MATGVYTANPSGASAQLGQSTPCPLTSLPAPPCFSPKTHNKIIQQSGHDSCPGRNSCPAHKSAKQALKLSPPNVWHVKRRGLLLASVAEGTRSLSCSHPEHRGAGEHTEARDQPPSSVYDFLGPLPGPGQTREELTPQSFHANTHLCRACSELRPKCSGVQPSPALGRTVERSALMLLPAPPMDRLVTEAPGSQCSASGCPCSVLLLGAIAEPGP